MMYSSEMDVHVVYVSRSVTKVCTSVLSSMRFYNRWGETWVSRVSPVTCLVMSAMILPLRQSTIPRLRLGATATEEMTLAVMHLRVEERWKFGASLSA